MDNSVNSLKISYWNANGIFHKSHDFFRFLSNNEIDVSLVCETFLKTNLKLSHSDYKIYRLDRTGRRKGGVAVIVKSGILHTLLPSFHLKVLEAIGISIVTSTGPITLVSVYNPGANRDDRSFIDDIKTLTKIRNSYFICGDLNARHRLWNCSRANTAGNSLFDELQTGSFIIQHPPSSTYIPSDPNRRCSTLDIVLTNGQHTMTIPQISTDLSSDHLPVQFEIDSSNVQTIHPRAIPDYSRADWQGFKSFLDANIDLQQLDLSSITATFQVDNMIDYFTTLLEQAHERYIPRIVPSKYKLILPDDILLLIRLRNARRRQWQRNRRDTYLKAQYDHINGLVKQRIDELRNDAWAKNLLDMNRDTNNRRKLWKFTKLIKNKHTSIPPLKKDGNILVTDQEKCDEIGRHFANAHLTTFHDVSPIEQEVNSTVADFLSTNENIRPDPRFLTKPKEVSSFIQKLKNSKCPGMDNINNRCLKRLSRKALVFLTFIFNSCISLNYFPLTWKHAKVIAIPKPNKDHSLSKNYRPISLLSSLSKIFEKVLLNRLNKHISDNEIIPASQFGFRSEHSTVHQLDRLVNNVKHNRDNKKSTGLVLLDNEKAFDTVWHGGLLYKMIALHFPPFLINLVRSFLKDRDFVVSVGTGVSSI